MIREEFEDGFHVSRPEKNVCQESVYVRLFLVLWLSDVLMSVFHFSPGLGLD